jgi:hypothetical protein
MPIVFALGSYHCEAGLGNKDQQHGNVNDSDNTPDGLSDAARQRNLPKELRNGGDGE